MLIGSGCGVPGVMACRTIENERDRQHDHHDHDVHPLRRQDAYHRLAGGCSCSTTARVGRHLRPTFLGVAAIIVCSGIILKKTKMFAGDPAPFVMELPAYHAPTVGSIHSSMWERGWSFIKRAGTVIVVSSILIWFTSGYGWAPVQTEADAADTEAAETTEDGEAVSVVDAPVHVRRGRRYGRKYAGQGGVPPLRRYSSPWASTVWQATVATVMGLVAKEEVVGVFGVLFGVTDEEGEDAAAGIVEDEDMTDEEKAAELSPISDAFEESSGGHGQ